MQMRDYQVDAVESVLEQFKTVDSTLIVVPTGCGKTVISANIISQMLAANPGKRAMCIAHREELVFQNAKTIERVIGEKVAIEMADQWSAEHPGVFGGPSRVVSATVQTLSMSRGGRMERFKPNDFCLFWTDEAHHATAETYKKVADYFCANSKCKHLGVTATPDRGDEEALGQIYESVAFEYEILDAINGGYLVPVVAKQVEVAGLDFSAMRTTAGDLNSADLAELMETERLLHEVAGPTMELSAGRRTLIFTVTVAQAERLCEILNRHKQGSARIVHGGTDKDERRTMLVEYGQDKFQYLVNVGVATEGFDSPGIELVVMARPTKSRALYAQMAGRGMRILPGVIDHIDDATERKRLIAASAKPCCTLLDFVGNAGRHKLICPTDILGGKYSDEVTERAAANAKKKGGGNVVDELEGAERELLDEKKRALVKARAKFQTADVSPFDVYDMAPQRERAWHKGRKPTPRMCEVLTNIGVKNPANLSFTEAASIMQETRERRDRGECTFKQARTLLKYGYDGHVSFTEASRIIDALAKNGWKRPD